jgi:hypothetical protein
MYFCQKFPDLTSYQSYCVYVITWCNQGYQMVYFQPKIAIWVYLEDLECKILVYFMAIWYVYLRQLCKLHNHLV